LFVHIFCCKVSHYLCRVSRTFCASFDGDAVKVDLIDDKDVEGGDAVKVVDADGADVEYRLLALMTTMMANYVHFAYDDVDFVNDDVLVDVVNVFDVVID
jgi:hypothetical protein